MNAYAFVYILFCCKQVKKLPQKQDRAHALLNEGDSISKSA